MNGVELIAAERHRQIEKEGWTPAHDDKHVHCELAEVAACYATPNPQQMCVRAGIDDVSGGRGECAVYGETEFTVPLVWPETWHPAWWNPTDRITDLVKAGALIAAEIDRLQRLSANV
jgi:hypothetical protein